MANSYSWDIPAVDCRPLEEGNTDVVYNVHWRYSASDGVAEPDTKKATIIGTQTVAAPEGDFIPFADLTTDIVVSWITPEMDVVEMKANLDAQIAELENPTSVTLPLPSNE